jgi:hypothetical protein
MLQILEEAQGIGQEPISPEEREELRELKGLYGMLREKANNRSKCKNQGSSSHSGGNRSCEDDSCSEDDDEEQEDVVEM